MEVVERFRLFPQKWFPDVPGANFPNGLSDVHVGGEVCPGNPPRPAGMLTTRIIGRPLDEEGQPVKSTYRQEEYMEATLEFPVEVQKQLVADCRMAQGKRFNIPDSFSRRLIGSAYLGQLDVQPMGKHQGRNLFANWEFTGQAKPSDGGGAAKDNVIIEVTGFSDVSGEVSAARRRAVFWEHRVRLHWRGTIKVSNSRMRELRLLAEGQEKLVWDLPGNAVATATDVQRLMSGHEINLDTEVRYGVITEDE